MRHFQNATLLLAVTALVAFMPTLAAEAKPASSVTSGDVRAKAADPAAEINALKNRLEHDHENVQLHYLLANAYVKCRRLDLAVMEYELCARLQPSSQAGIYAAAALRNLPVQRPAQRSNESRMSPEDLQETQVPSPGRAQQLPAEPAPIVNHIDMISAPPGTSITIEGSGFSNNPHENEVTFGGVPAPVSSATSNSITCVVPEMYYPQWNVPVVVKTRGVSSNDSVKIRIQSKLIPN